MSTTQQNRSKEAFQVPNGYFEAVNDRILAMTTGAQKNPFSTPKGYFASLDSFDWIKKTKKRPNVFQLKTFRYTAVAAIFIAVILLTNIPSLSQFETIEDAEIMELVEANWIDAYEFELAENINTSEWTLEIVSTNTIYEHLISNPNTMDEYYLLEEPYK
jgi:hypothetical protein